MQKFCRSLSSTLAVAALAHGSIQAQLVVCPGEPVQFEIQDTYYGIKVWEYSSDGVLWTPTTVEESTPFLVTPQVAGYYRVRFDDLDCDTTYYSNVVQLSWPDQMVLNSVFEDGIVPLGLDPVIWITDTAGLSNVVYTVNGLELPSTQTFQPLSNPGVDFTVFASAVDQNGCTVHSDTLSFEVVDTNIAGNGSVELTAEVDMGNVQVRSNRDTVSIAADSSFSITYNLDYISDLIVAFRSDGTDQGEVVALRRVFSGEEYLLLDERTTAWTLFFSNPFVYLTASEHADSLKSWLDGQPDFNLLELDIQNDLEELGYVLLNAPEKLELVNSLVITFLEEFENGFRGGDDLMAPRLTSTGDSLVYDHWGINAVYVAQVNHGEQSVTNPKLIPFRPDAAPSHFQQAVLNAMAKMFGMDARLRFLANDRIALDQINVADQFAHLDVLLANGYYCANCSADSLAFAYNRKVQIYQLVSFLPLGELGSCYGAIAATVSNALVQGDAATTLSEITTICGQAIGQIAVDAALCGVEILGLTTVGIAYNTGWWIQALYDVKIQEPRVTYQFTKVNDFIHGRVVVEHNSFDSFVGIPGSKVVSEPQITLKEYGDRVLGPTGDVIHSSSLGGYWNLPSSDGFTFMGFMDANTASVQLNEGLEYSGLGFVDVAMDFNNEFNWKLSNTSEPMGSTQITIQIRHNGVNLPATTQGYEYENVQFEAAIEQPILTIDDGDGQSGSANNPLPDLCWVQLTSASGTPIRDYALHAEILEGGGSLVDNAVLSQMDGQASFDWTLGAYGPQTMRVVVDPSGSDVLAEVEFTSVTLDCEGIAGGSAMPGTPCDDGNSSTGNDTWDWNCNCTGLLIDCLGVPGGSATPGSQCDDGNPNTGYDVWNGDCICIGFDTDCESVVGGNSWPGTPCDDGDPGTENDTWDSNCNCSGLLIDCLGVIGGSSLPGTPCNDGDPSTPNDKWTASCECHGSVEDFNGNSYPAISIGQQVWMTENLRSTHYRDGTTIPNVIDYTSWSQLNSGAWCNYNNSPGNDATYGKLYNWFAAANPNICPDGWHVPTSAEWTVLIDYLGGFQTAGGKMKAVSPLWVAPNAYATNISGFSGLPGGDRYYFATNFTNFSSLGYYGYWWSASALNAETAFYYYLVYSQASVGHANSNKTAGFCVRCVRD